MEKIMEKIEVYHFINYLLPGIIFGSILTKIIQEDFLDTNIVIAIIEYYFIGLVLSRIGSIIIKPILEKVKIINCEEYEQYLQCSEKDNKVDLLQREANQYRTYIATFLCLTIFEVYYSIINKQFYAILILFLALTIIFILSYKKQVQFIAKRIQHVKCKYD